MLIQLHFPGPFGEMLENEMVKCSDKPSQKLDQHLTFLQELLNETRQQREQLDLAAVETIGQRCSSTTLASSQSLEDETNSNSTQNDQQDPFSSPTLSVKEWVQPVTEKPPLNTCLPQSITADIKRHLVC